ncbi:N-acetyltransferase [Ilyobacter sp.]|uniref:N-acetyltransferase n=1 Tax=Ilyobacter sp. TaxID=3100343 RepID=UPI003568F335
MAIRKIKEEEILEAVELWYEVSVKAHNFISSDFWKKNKELMATKYLPASETYIAVEGGKILGFVAMAENFLAAIFVDEKEQGKGIGKNLINHVKEGREVIRLNVYKKNQKTIDFYKSQGFKIISEKLEVATNEVEFIMEWTT